MLLKQICFYFILFFSVLNFCIGKKFITAKPSDMYWKMVQFKQPSVYKIISEPQPVSLYLNVEISSSDEYQFTYAESVAIINFINDQLESHLKLSFPILDIDKGKCIILHACNATKLSTHIIHKGVAFEEHTCSYTAYVVEFDAYVKIKLLTVPGMHKIIFINQFFLILLNLLAMILLWMRRVDF
jgi:hypothetical protein